MSSKKTDDDDNLTKIDVNDISKACFNMLTEMEIDRDHISKGQRDEISTYLWDYLIENLDKIHDEDLASRKKLMVKEKHTLYVRSLFTLLAMTYIEGVNLNKFVDLSLES